MIQYTQYYLVPVIQRRGYLNLQLFSVILTFLLYCCYYHIYIKVNIDTINASNKRLCSFKHLYPVSTSLSGKKLMESKWLKKKNSTKLKTSEM